MNKSKLSLERSVCRVTSPLGRPAPKALADVFGDVKEAGAIVHVGCPPPSSRLRILPTHCVVPGDHPASSQLLRVEGRNSRGGCGQERLDLCRHLDGVGSLCHLVVAARLEERDLHLASPQLKVLVE